MPFSVLMFQMTLIQNFILKLNIVAFICNANVLFISRFLSGVIRTLTHAS